MGAAIRGHLLDLFDLAAVFAFDPAAPEFVADLFFHIRIKTGYDPPIFKLQLLRRWRTLFARFRLKSAQRRIPAVDYAERPCYYKGKGRSTGSYLRVGDADLVMMHLELYSYEAFRRHLHDDERQIPAPPCRSSIRTRRKAGHDPAGYPAQPKSEILYRMINKHLGERYLFARCHFVYLFCSVVYIILSI